MALIRRVLFVFGTFIWVSSPGIGAAQPLAAADPEAFTRWSITGFAGPLTVNDTTTSIFLGGFEAHSTIAGVALSRYLFSYDADLLFEGEIQFIRHFGGQDHFEINMLLIARWQTFPWNRVLPTTIAVGVGPSIASQVPRLERERRPQHSQVLNELFGEVTIGVPGLPRWSLSGRFQHRSGILTLINNVQDASTVLAGGVKYRF